MRTKVDIRTINNGITRRALIRLEPDSGEDIWSVKWWINGIYHPQWYYEGDYEDAVGTALQEMNRLICAEPQDTDEIKQIRERIYEEMHDQFSKDDIINMFIDNMSEEDLRAYFDMPAKES